MKLCWSCAREIPESATICDHCGHQAADLTAPVSASDDLIELPPLSGHDRLQPVVQRAPSGHDQPQSAVQPPPAKAALETMGIRMNRRTLAAIACGVGGVGILALVLLTGRGSASPEAAGAPKETPTEKSRSASPAPAALKGKWSSENRAHWTGHQRKSAAFDLPAESKVQVWMRQVQPMLVVRCLSNSTQVFVFTNSAARIEPGTEDHTVRVALDGEPETTERWPDSDEHDALFAPDGAAFAQRLMAARTMRFGFTPHNAQPVTVHFNVGGLGELMEPVAKECGWKKEPAVVPGS